MESERVILTDAARMAVLTALASGQKTAVQLLASLTAQNIALRGGKAAIHVLLYLLEAERVIHSRLEKESGVWHRRYRLTPRGCRAIGVPPEKRGSLFSFTPEPSPASPRKQIAAAGLPDESRAWFERFIKRTGFFQSQNRDILRDLLWHVREARCPATELGDAGALDALLSRAWMRKQRWTFFVALRFAQAYFVLIPLYLIACIAFAFLKPTVRVDYGAQLNAVALASSPDDRAWPIYREAFASYQGRYVNFEEVEVVTTGDGRRFPRPGEAGWEKVAPFLEKHRVLLEAARRGAAKPCFGLESKFEEQYSDEDFNGFSWGAKVSRAHHPDGPPVNRDGPKGWIGLKPEYGLNFGGSINLLVLDMDDAASKHDSDRVCLDYRSILAIARQCAERGTVIPQLLAIRFELQAGSEFVSILQRDPALFTTPQLADIVQQTLTSADRPFQIENDKKIYLDLFQRLYSDNGRGDGWLTSEGCEAVLYVRDDGFGPHWEGEPRSDRFDRVVHISLFLATPAISTFAPSRREVTEQIEKYFELLDPSRPLWVQMRSEDKAGLLMQSWFKSHSTLYYLMLLQTETTLPRGDLVRTAKVARAVKAATAVAAALELFRRENGHYPATPAELAPRFLPTPPLDDSTGEPLLMVIRDGQPVLYGRGYNGKDDGGVEVVDKLYHQPFAREGDWILYPGKADAPLMSAEEKARLDAEKANPSKGITLDDLFAKRDTQPAKPETPR